MPKFNMTDKFTAKFPRPRAMKGLSFSDAPSASVLEDGHGLGIERVGTWTLHKWCLVLSMHAVGLRRACCIRVDVCRPERTRVLWSGTPAEVLI